MPKRIVIDTERETVLATLRDGQPIRDIARQHHCDQKTIKKIATAAGASIMKPKGSPDCRLGAILKRYRIGSRIAVELTPNERRTQLIVRLKEKHGRAIARLLNLRP
jgi:hypothetical protein